MSPEDPAVDDLREVIRLGLARGAELLTAGERRIADRILALDGEPASLYARLSCRKRRCFHLPTLRIRRVDDPLAAADVLFGAELGDGLVSWPERARHLPRPLLVEACRSLALPTSGSRAELCLRLAAHRGWIPGRWLRIRHRDLVTRLERWAFLSAHPERSTLVLARLGLIRWAEYPLTSGAGLFPDRRALLAWEALLTGPIDAEGALLALRSGVGRSVPGLDRTRSLTRVVREEAHARARAGDPVRAAAWYRALAEGAFERPGRIAARWARAEERSGRLTEALEILRSARRDARPSEQVAIGRIGRRLGRAARCGFPPAIPLVGPRLRSVRLLPAGSARGRPLWCSTVASEPPLPVEEAVVALLAALGRRAIRAEGPPWSTLFAALCAELWFLPIPGALPVRFLSGPLDLGTPGFRAARRAEVDALLAAVDRGEAPARIRAADPVWRGIRLTGARWDLVDAETLAALAEGIGPAGLRVLVEALLDHGPRASAGLPDLVLLPGEPARIPDAHPSRLSPQLTLIEIKGPGDTVRDEQSVWHDRLVRAGARLELWEVGPPPG